MLGSVSHGSEGRPTPLDKLHVLEISDRMAGSYCGKLLVDAGAHVRKIEPPQGDPLRTYSASCAPVPEGAPAAPLYCYLNAGKQSLTLAPDSQRYRAELAAADVLIVTAGRSQAGGWASIRCNCWLTRRRPSSSRSPTSAGPVRSLSVPLASSPCRRGRARLAFAVIRLDRPSRSAETWASTWAARSPHSVRWPYVAGSNVAVRGAP